MIWLIVLNMNILSCQFSEYYSMILANFMRIINVCFKCYSFKISLYKIEFGLKLLSWILVLKCGDLDFSIYDYWILKFLMETES